MAKRVFALASVAALTGLWSAMCVVGCSDGTDPVAPTRDGGGGGSEKDVTSSPVNNNTNADSWSCAQKEKIDVSSLPFKPPAVKPGACSDDDQKFIRTTLDDAPSITFPDLEKALKARNPNCSSCVFGDDTGDTWAVLVKVSDDYIKNVGGCFAVVSGSISCGKAFFQADRCISTACSECTSTGDVLACMAEVEAADGICWDPWNAFTTECGSESKHYTAKCTRDAAGDPYKYAFEGSIAQQCGGEAPDGGKDGG